MASTSKSSEDTSAREESSEARDSDITDGEEADISECSAAAVSGFMAKFKQPDPSHLTRKRKIQCNPPVGMKRSKGRNYQLKRAY